MYDSVECLLAYRHWPRQRSRILCKAAELSWGREIVIKHIEGRFPN